MSEEPKLSKVELLKASSHQLLGTLAEEICNDKPEFTDDAATLLKHHGSYLQDDRDLRKAKDADGNKLGKQYSCMVRTRIPGGRVTAAQFLAELDLCETLGSGTLRINSDQKQEFDLQVRARDAGFPRRTTEQTLKVRVVDPPPPPPEPAAKLAFDDATQTVLTALVQGRDEWTAWMHVRTRDKTLRLKVGDGFEIGSLKGQVIEVTPRFVMLEIDGRRFTLKPAGNLKEAAKRAEDD